jgi:hypothetical protein
MSVGETRHHEVPARVDDFRFRPDAGPDRGGRTDGDELAVLDGERLGQRRTLARGEHLGVDDHKVRGLGERGGDEKERDQDCGSLKQHHPLVSWRAHLSSVTQQPKSIPAASRPHSLAMRHYIGGVPLAASTSPAR